MWKGLEKGLDSRGHVLQPTYGSDPLFLHFLGCLFYPVDLVLQLCRLFAVEFIQAGEVDG